MANSRGRFPVYHALMASLLVGVVSLLLGSSSSNCKPRLGLSSLRLWTRSIQPRRCSNRPRRLERRGRGLPQQAAQVVHGLSQNGDVGCRCRLPSVLRFFENFQCLGKNRPSLIVGDADDPFSPGL